ncbi:MAG: GPR endopeptidase [Bacillota bacterium]
MPDIRTDLAVESAQLRQVKDSQTMEGVTQEQTEPVKGIQVYRVEITNDQGAKSLGKPVGKYISLDMENPFDQGAKFLEDASREFSVHIRALVQPFKKGDAPVLIIGLGNRDVTPDSLGPRVVERLLITRHMKDSVPQELTNRLHSVCALAPGVLGVTGMETAEIVRGIVETTHPCVIIAIDALAARSLHRIAASAQVSDTGIRPGSGLGNRRKGIEKETMGVPVVAIGVPMVVYASTIAHDTVEQVMIDMKVSQEDAANLLEYVHKKAVDDMGDMVVTPKEVDELVDRCADLLADALNMALHENVTLEDVRRFMS